ncbi:hypothetical protein [Flavobacterium terrigena]|uniref:Uncharacterized protein n=1 Tax=Flavobacterium terrigena TaxID=402734 RepID=A0A1H6W1N4_9FLAO|nr:hypothetical protein [Flavobacterium terrigena]SEJ10848.1 hypothetical protein SAMN05660918_2395 [Flavobacterium terrigena]
MKKRHQQKLVIVSIVLLICLNMPIVLLFDSSKSVFGFPSSYIFIFSTWLLSIFISLYIMIRYNE